ncbi:MAG TPA: hypothetical protein VN228_08105 [Pyrinomonadaceae bacterium]|nr:hypothetical protein [Pyrinomonadaceae bacterium]
MKWFGRRKVLAAAAVFAGLPLAYLTCALAQRQAARPPRAAKAITVRAGDDLQRALDAAAPGDEVVLEAGATFVGNFTLPVKAGASFVTVRSSRLAELPEGRRVSPSDAARMARVATPNSGPAILAPPGSHHWRLLGLEITQAAGRLTYDLVQLGDGDTEGPQDSAEKAPRHFRIDRCLVRAFDARAPLKRGVALNSAHTEIINSHVSGAKVAGQDSQAVAGWNGPGPFLIENNYLEGAGENILFGGAVSAARGLVPSDITVRRNLVSKPLSWKQGDPAYAGEAWQVKNLFELKSARRVLVEANVFENNWAHAQSGFAVVLTVGNDSGAWAQVEDVTFQNNLVRNVAQALNIRARDDVPGSGLRRVAVRNNLFVGVEGIFLQLLRGAVALTVDHNTVLHGKTVVAFESAGEGEENEAFAFTNNVLRHNNYGLFGSGGAMGTAALEQFCRRWRFAGNILAGADPSKYPPGNLYPPALDPKFFADAARGDYRLADPRLRGRAADGKDPGCDFDEWRAALAWHLGG